MADIVIDDPDPSFCTKTSLIQLGYGIWVSMTMVGVGLAFNFPAVNIPQLKSIDSSVGITLSEESWIASILTMMALTGSIICGILLDKYGRKAILLACEVPMCAGWIYTGLAKSAINIIIGRAITGIGVGMAMGGPRIYITEITLPNMRGTVGAFPNLSLSVGLIIMAMSGVFLHWNIICFGAAGLTFCIFCANLFLPETPFYVLLKKTEADALKSLKRFRSQNYSPEQEISDMNDFKTENCLRRLTFKGQIAQMFTKTSCKCFSIVAIYMLFTQLCGVSIVYTWTIELLEATHSSVDAHIGNVIMGVVRLVAGILTFFLSYRFGRKPLAMISGLGVGVICVFLGTYLHYVTTPNVAPLICLSMYVVFATIGYYTLPLLIMYEIYPLQIRGILGGITTAFFNCLVFGTNKSYPYVRNMIGHANVILIFGIISLVGCVYICLYLPETKGLTLQEIEEYFNERRPTLVSQRSVLAVQMSASSKLDISSSKQGRLSDSATKPRKKKKVLRTSTIELDDDEKKNEDEVEEGPSRSSSKLNESSTKKDQKPNQGSSSSEEEDGQLKASPSRQSKVGFSDKKPKST